MSPRRRELARLAHRHAVARNRAAELLLRYGQIDGAHHKTWVIDQALRILLGDAYDDVAHGDPEHPWDVGIAP